MSGVDAPISFESLLLGRTFHKPSEDGPIWAISLRNEHGLVLASAITVSLTFIFARIWKVIRVLALSFPGEELEREQKHDNGPALEKRRHEVLFALWNSKGPVSALRDLFVSTVRSVGDWQHFVYGFTFCVLAVIIYAGSLILSIVIPSKLQIGNVAPVRPSLLYYPDLPYDKSTIEMLQWYNIVAAESLRALGSVRAAESEVRKRVKITVHKGSDYYKSQADGSLELAYEYNITGVDLGLQYGNGLLLRVQGYCRTQYSWLVNRTASEDVYNLWNDQASMQRVPIDNMSIMNTPNVMFVRHPDPQPSEPQQKSNTSFAVVITSAYRASLTPSSDVWYKTERLNTTDNALYGAAYRIMRGRPALSCWQNDEWSYKYAGKVTIVGNVSELGEIHGIRIKKTMRHVLKTVFEFPVVMTLGIAGGDSALRPGIKSLDRTADFIDAETTRLESDMERLIFASYIKSKNALVDTAMFESRGSLPNIMAYSRAEPRPDAGEFVISSGNVQTFSMLGLIILAAVLLVLLMIDMAIMVHLKLERSREALRSNLGFEDLESPDGPQVGIKRTTTLYGLTKELSPTPTYRHHKDNHKTMHVGGRRGTDVSMTPAKSEVLNN